MCGTPHNAYSMCGIMLIRLAADMQELSLQADVPYILPHVSNLFASTTHTPSKQIADTLQGLAVSCTSKLQARISKEASFLVRAGLFPSAKYVKAQAVAKASKVHLQPGLCGVCCNGCQAQGVTSVANLSCRAQFLGRFGWFSHHHSQGVECLDCQQASFRIWTDSTSGAKHAMLRCLGATLL
jgi:hypothetical protein